ncbi:MAG: hypothetical protein JXN62_10215, partial [Bacteroidales bacterium]|nr:hypothetical protein [Bacteroidales bacterium]
MRRNLIIKVLKSILYNRKDAVYQIIIVALLAAIISGSLLTGYSVRSSLRKNASEKLGKTDLLISSGLRYFDPSLAARFSDVTGEKAVALLEMDGYCQNFSTGETVLNVKIYGIDDDFFKFHGTDSVRIESGTVALNEGLSERLDIKPGDDVIVSLHDPDPVPANAPFATSRKNNQQLVFRTGKILGSEQNGNFSLGISQMLPLNIFINISDLESGYLKSNRILVQNTQFIPISYFRNNLAEILRPSDIGLKVRISEKTKESEIISERIFIDSSLVDEIGQIIPQAEPVLTYLANELSVKEKTTPYSFVSALPESSLYDINNNEILINRWLADDLDAQGGDTLIMTWYYPVPGNLLEERSRSFRIKSIIDNNSRLSDSLLMPDFPGISGSTTCSAWDAGIPLLLDRIRDKDEDYWNRY